MKKQFGFGRFEKTVWYISVSLSVTLAAVSAALFLTSGGKDFVAAWFTAIAAATVVLMLLSVPQRIIVGNDTVEIRCLVESTYLQLDEIIDAEVPEKGFGKRLLPLGGAFGFWGYYGWYIDRKERRMYMVYASQRSSLVAIHTSRRRYIVSCDKAEELVRAIYEARSRSGEET